MKRTADHLIIASVVTVTSRVDLNNDFLQECHRLQRYRCAHAAEVTPI